MLAIGRRFFGIQDHARLRLHEADGLHYFASAPANIFDVVIIDVAERARDVHSGAEASVDLRGPPEAFLGDTCLGGAVWSKLRPNALLAVNVLGGRAHAERVCKTLSRCVCRREYRRGEHACTVSAQCRAGASAVNSNVRMQVWRLCDGATSRTGGHLCNAEPERS